MVINELKIKHFGQFSDRTIRLSEGINLIIGDNESGKSTVHAFIRGMLFGMRRGRGRASRTDGFSQYEPWDNPAYYAGEMEFSSGGKRFRLSRDFSRGGAGARLVCLTDGEVLSVEDGDLAMLLGNISETAYDNTVSAGQLRGQTDEALAGELQNYMANYQGSSDAALDVSAALEQLRRRRRELEAARRDLTREQEEAERELAARIRVQEEECSREEAELAGVKAQMKREIFGREVSPAEVRKERERSMRRHRWTFACAAIAVLLIGVCVLQFFKVSSLLVRAGLALAVLALLYLAARMLHHHREEESGGADSEEQRLRKLNWNAEYRERELQQKRTMLDNLRTELEERQEAASQGAYEEELEAVSLAETTIRELSGELQKRAGVRMQERMSGILAELTDGRYRKVSLDEKMQIYLQTDERFLPLSRVSRGTMEQVWFALRMGAMEVLCGEEELPVALDEAFALYDGKRLRQAMRWLAGERRQVLIFTCQEREEEALLKLGLPYHRIAL